MIVWTFTIAYQEARMAPWWIRHYAQWVDRMVVWLEPSTDGTESILKSCPKVDLRPWGFRGLDDDKFLAKVNSCYYEARGKADFVAFVDMDELLYHPIMPHVLKDAPGDVLPSTGYALISPDGWPEDDGHSQLYELVKTGVPQPNYDKLLLHRPHIKLEHTIGRHRYGKHWPKHNGTVCPDYGIKLYHCHYIGGPDETAARNKRNYDRCLNKKYGWNMINHDPKQVDTVEWVRESLNHLQQVWP